MSNLKSGAVRANSPLWRDRVGHEYWQECDLTDTYLLNIIRYLQRRDWLQPPTPTELHMCSIADERGLSRHAHHQMPNLIAQPRDGYGY